MCFLFINKTLRLNPLKTRTAMNARISVFVICVEVIIYLLLHNFHDCTLLSLVSVRIFTEFYRTERLGFNRLNHIQHLHVSISKMISVKRKLANKTLAQNVKLFVKLKKGWQTKRPLYCLEYQKAMFLRNIWPNYK